MKNLNNIVFDFGDVFINLNKKLAYQQIEKHQITDFEVLYKYEKGQIETDDFLKYFDDKIPSLNKQSLKEVWNLIIADFPLKRLEWLEGVSKSNKYRLFLLSNTNDLHIKKIIEVMGVDNFNRFCYCFEKVYLSYEIGMRKPDREIFEFVLKENKFTSEETLFVDDTLENIQIAKSLGFQTWHLEVGEEEVTELFNNV